MLLGVGITGTIGQFFLTGAYAAGAPTRVSVIGLSQLVFAMVFDAAIWGRIMTPTAIAGSCLVLAPTSWLMLGAGRREADGAEESKRRLEAVLSGTTSNEVVGASDAPGDR